MKAICVFCPSKINLFLGVDGERPDGYHDIGTLMVPLDFGDEIIWQLDDRLEEDVIVVEGDEGTFALKDNTVSRALQGFRDHYFFSERLKIVLKKRIPMEAGFGGGSSDAGSFLLSLNRFFENPLSSNVLKTIALGIGSDVPFFLNSKSCFVTGRGEIDHAIGADLEIWLSQKCWCLFKPVFGMPTAFAYNYLRKHKLYRGGGVSVKDYRNWEKRLLKGDVCFENDFLPAIQFRYPILFLAMQALKENGFQAGLSGSGTGCFILLEEGSQLPLIKTILANWFGAIPSAAFRLYAAKSLNGVGSLKG